MSLQSSTLQYKHFRVSYPQDHIIQVTLDRPDKLNCIDKTTSQQITDIWQQFDEDENLWVGIITGYGRAFCTGADLQGKLFCAKIDEKEADSICQNGTT
jgi:enoyl-CoA hydratase/carnithine racemase